jgi:hypothetical protein
MHRGEQRLDDLFDRALEVFSECNRIAADLDQAFDLSVGERAPPRPLAEGPHDLLAAAGVVGRRRGAGDDTRAQRGVGEDLLGQAVGGVEVLLVLRIGHAERGGDRVEAERLFVGDERGRGGGVHAEQIANGVVVLGVVEPMDADAVHVASGCGGIAGRVRTGASGPRRIGARREGPGPGRGARHDEAVAASRGLDLTRAGRDGHCQRRRSRQHTSWTARACESFLGDDDHAMAS